MKTVPTLAVVLLTAFATVADAQPPSRVPTVSGWGPSWIGGGPPGGNRRPGKLEKSLTAVAISNDSSVIGFTVRFWGDAEVQKGNTYQLLYQLRLHTKKGELGPILGTAEKPNGISDVVTSGVADSAWNGLEGSVDVNRKDISGRTNLPAEGLVTLRVEPQLYDLKADKFLTPGKTPAIIALATVGNKGRVESVVPLRVWIVANAQYSADKVLDKLADLDEYDVYANGVGEAIGQVLAIKEMPAETKVRFIRAVPKQAVDARLSPNLWRTLKDFATGDDASLKKAATTKLAEAE